MAIVQTYHPNIIWISIKVIDTYLEISGIIPDNWDWWNSVHRSVASSPQEPGGQESSEK